MYVNEFMFGFLVGFAFTVALIIAIGTMRGDK